MATVTGPEDAGHVEGALSFVQLGSSGLGLSPATALMLASIIGFGLFNLPISLPAWRPITPVWVGLTTIGAIALALLFVASSGRLPGDGGPYTYAGGSRKT